MDGSSARMGGRRRRRAAVAFVVATAMVFAMVPSTAFGGWQRYMGPELVSVNAFAVPGNDNSYHPSISDDGRYVAFDSRASNLSPDDVNLGGDGNRDVFVRDRHTDQTSLVSLTPTGALDPDRGARSPSISDDGRYVAFVTGRDMVPEDQNGDQDLYIKDLHTGEYTWLDAFGDGSALGSDAYDLRISGNGEHVIFDSHSQLVPEDTNGRRDVYLWSWMADEFIWVTETPAGATETNRGAQSDGISDDGRYVAFVTGRDMVPEDDNVTQDLYIWDGTTGEFHWQDVTGDGSGIGPVENVRISGDGEYVVMTLEDDIAPGDTNGRKDVYRWSVIDEELIWVSETPEWAGTPDRGADQGTISDDGSVIAFFSGRDFVPEDTNEDWDVYVRDMVTGEFRLVPLMSDGSTPGNDVDDLTISGNGAWLAFNWEVDEGIMRLGAQYYDPSADPNAVVPQAAVTDDEQIYVIGLESPFDPGLSRLSGSDRYGTAVAVSQDVFPLGADTVVIATGTNWPDALCASALAGAVVGPVLLTRPDTLPESVIAELNRLDARHAYIVGGSTAVSYAVEEQLNDLLPGYVVRLSGSDRYGTSRAVANRVIDILGPTYSGNALVTTGMNYPDALAGAPLAAGLEWPVLLSRTDGTVYIPLDTDEVMILGSTSAVPASVETFLKTKLGNDAVTRVGGADRYETAAKVAQAGVDAGLLWNGVGMATGEGFADGLTGGCAVGLQRSVLLLTPYATLNGNTRDALEDNKDDIATVRFFGGTNVLSPGVQNAVKTILGL